MGWLVSAHILLFCGDAFVYIKMKIIQQGMPKYLANLPLYVFAQPLTFTCLPETQLYCQDKPLIQDFSTYCMHMHVS